MLHCITRGRHLNDNYNFTITGELRLCWVSSDYLLALLEADVRNSVKININRIPYVGMSYTRIKKGIKHITLRKRIVQLTVP